MAAAASPKVDMIPAGDRETWLKLRAQDVTASAAASLLDVHPYLSAFQLWMLKAGKLAEDPEMTPAMERGVLLEPVAFQLLQKKPELASWHFTHNTGSSQIYLREPAMRIGATPDVIGTNKFGGRCVVQIKTVSTFAFDASWLLEGTISKPASWVIEPPNYVVVQAIVEAYLAGAQKAFVAALVWTDGLYLPVVEVPVHLGIVERLKGEVRDFWSSIKAGVEPVPDYAKDKDILMAMGRRDNGRELNLSSDNAMPSLLADRSELKAKIKLAQEALEPIEADIINKIGEYERAYLPGWTIKRPTIDRAGYEVKPGSYRRLDIRPAKAR